MVWRDTPRRSAISVLVLPVAGMTISSRNSPGWAGSMSRWRRPLLLAMIILQIDFNRIFAIPREGDAPIRRDMDRVAGALARQRVKVHADHRDLRRLGCRIKPRQNKAHLLD